MIVAQDGSGDFTTIQAALDQIPDDNSTRTVIKIKSGVYKEKLYVEKQYITLEGYGGDTVITYDDHAHKALPNGGKYGTFYSYSVLIAANDFIAKGITFENSAGPGSEVGQALALYIDADRVAFKDCKFLGHQDTIFTAPLPIDALPGEQVENPRQDLKRELSRIYFKDCYLTGDVDFIFGSATAVFDSCELRSNDRHGGYITAASTPENTKYGYVFIDCKLVSDAPENSVYLGRPWRDYAQTVFINTYMGAHIKEEGWHNWGREKREQTTFYAEHNSYGPGAKLDKRVKWAKFLTDQEAAEYTVANVLAGNDGWNPQFD